MKVRREGLVELSSVIFSLFVGYRGAPDRAWRYGEMLERYAFGRRLSTARRCWCSGGRERFLDGQRPVDVLRLHREEKRSRILVEVSRVAAGTPAIHRDAKRSAADVAVNLDTETPPAR